MKNKRPAWEKIDILDCVEILLQNLYECIRLWGKTRKMKNILNKENFLEDTKMILGENIVRISNLKGIDNENYKNEILPRIFETIGKFPKITSAQQYLFDCIVQVFPDEFHLITINEFLNECKKYADKFDITQILISLLDRLTNFANSQKTLFLTIVSKKMNFYENLVMIINSIIQNKGLLMDINGMLNLYISIVKFIAKTQLGEIMKIDLILENIYKLVENHIGKNLSNSMNYNLLKMLYEIIENYDQNQIFELNNLQKIIPIISEENQLNLSIFLLTVFLNNFLIKYLENNQ